MTSPKSIDRRIYNGRKQLPDYDEKRSSILRTSAKLFATHGYDGTSVTDITRACRISKSTLYHYFQSKEDILYEIAHSYMTGFLADMEAFEETAAHISKLDRLRAFLRLSLARFQGARDQQRVVLNDLQKLPTERSAKIVDMQRVFLDHAQNLIVGVRPDLVKGPKEARARTMLFYGMLNWTMNWYDPEGGVKPDELIEMILSMTFERRSEPAG
ncbi:MAG: TetR/AcrR family transcriptional regulator [Pseudomonadota bacterium]|nr:TetR/AcrR family transcriptional regulator [Pseudomonadota bacterium]